MRNGLFAAAALMCVGAATSLAGPLRPEHVGAHATWVVHFDVEGLMASSVGPFLTKEAPFEGDDFDELRALGIDPIKDIKSLTAYGADDNGEDATGILESTEAIDEALAKISVEADDYKKITEGDMVIHSWTDGDESWYVYTKPGREPGRRIAVLAGSLERLRAAALTLERGGAAQARCLKEARPRAGSIFFVSASQIPAIAKEEEEVSRVLKFARAVVLDVGEEGQNLYTDLALDTDGQESATTLMQMAIGLKAFAQVACAGEPEAAGLCKFIEAIKVATEGVRVRVSFSIDVKALAEIAAQIEAMDDDGGDDADKDEDENDDDDDAVIIDEQKKVEVARHQRVD